MAAYLHVKAYLEQGSSVHDESCLDSRLMRMWHYAATVFVPLCIFWTLTRFPGWLHRDLREVRGLLSARQDDLDRARSRSQAAEAKYRELLTLADRHRKYGDTAADAAQGHGEKYEVGSNVIAA